MQKESGFIFILIAVCLVFFFFNLGSRALWDIDEGKHATTSKDMVLSGDWITPGYNGEKFYDKPPLHNWLVAISFLIFGFTEFAARLPAALLGLGCVMVTYGLGRKVLGPTGAFLSALVLATSVEFFALSRTVVHDISLAFFITLALALFYVGYENKKKRRSYFLAGYAALGFSILAKGPIGMLLPAAIIGLFLIVQKQLRFLRDMQIGRGMVIVLAIAAPWYVLISINDPDYVSYFFLKQNLGRFFSGDVRHEEPFYYYLPVLMGGMFPWSIFLPLALFRRIRAPQSASRNGMQFVLIWFAFTFIFFSAASSKLGTYLLPLFPAAALLVGGFLIDIIANPSGKPDRGLIFSYLPVVILSPLALIYLIFFSPADLMDETGIELKRLYLPAGWYAACCCVSMALVVKKHYRAFIGSIAAAVMSVLLFALVFLVPSIEPYRSSKFLAQKIDTLMAPGDDLVFYLKARETFLFYTNRRAIELKSRRQLRKHLASDERVFCIFKMDDWLDVKKLHKKMHIVILEGNKLIASNIKPNEN